jgi:hypothetical protein
VRGVGPDDADPKIGRGETGSKQDYKQGNHQSNCTREKPSRGFPLNSRASTR